MEIVVQLEHLEMKPFASHPLLLFHHRQEYELEEGQQAHEQRWEPEWDGVLVTSESMMAGILPLVRGHEKKGPDMRHIVEVAGGFLFAWFVWSVCLFYVSPFQYLR